MRKSDAITEVIYVDDFGGAAITHDGVGFVYYETEAEAVAETGCTVRYIDELRDDWDQDDYEEALYDELDDWLLEYGEIT